MTTETMRRTKVDENSRGAFYFSRITIPAESMSNAIILPTQNFSDVAFMTEATEDFTYEVTNSPEIFIQDDTALWTEYDGVSELNKAVNSVRITNDALTPISVDISVRTYGL